MTASKKQGSMYAMFDGSIPLAMPDLENVSGLVHMFDFEEQVSIDSNIFAQQYGFVASSDDSVHGATVAFIVLSILFFILGIVALVITKFKGGNNKTTESGERQLPQGEYS